MPRVNVSIQVIPRVTGDQDIYDIVDEAIGVIQQSGVKYEVGPMETTMEGEYDELMGRCEESPGSGDCGGKRAGDHHCEN